MAQGWMSTGFYRLGVGFPPCTVWVDLSIRIMCSMDRINLTASWARKNISITKIGVRMAMIAKMEIAKTRIKPPAAKVGSMASILRF